MEKLRIVRGVDYNGVSPTIHFSYQGRPSWRRYGDGVKRGKLVADKVGSFFGVFEECPDDSNRAREVFVSIPEEVAEWIAEQVNARKQRQAHDAIVTEVRRGNERRVKLLAAQDKLASEQGLPMAFIPSSGYCSCGSDLVDQNGDKLAKELITGCNACRSSFV